MKKETRQAKDVLKEYDLKATKPRELILAALGAERRPYNAQELFETLSKKHDIDLVTIYRTLASFEKAGLAKRVDLRQDAVAYELAGEHHHHIVCTECGTVEDFELCDMEAVTKKVVAKSKRFTAVREHTLELFGVCDSCVR